MAVFAGAEAVRAPAADVGIAGAALAIVTSLFLLSAWDFIAMLAGRAAHPRTLPRPAWRTPRWLAPTRASAGVVLFLYGILAGHFLWK